MTSEHHDHDLSVYFGKIPWPGRSLHSAQADGVRVVSLLILLLPCLFNQPSSFLPSALIVLLVASWNALFTRNTRTSLLFTVLLTSLLITLLLPNSISFWVLALCVSFGVVFGEQIYGGRTNSFLSPVIVTLAFLFFAFPIDSAPLIDSLNRSWLIMPIVILLLYQQLDWLALIGACLGLLAVAIFNQESSNGIDSLFAIATNLPTSIALLAVFVLSDTVLSARTPFGRLLSGVLTGVLFMRLSSTISHFESAIFSLLLAWIAIPLIDWLVLASKSQIHQAAPSGVIDE